MTVNDGIPTRKVGSDSGGYYRHYNRYNLLDEFLYTPEGSASMWVSSSQRENLGLSPNTHGTLRRLYDSIESPKTVIGRYRVSHLFDSSPVVGFSEYPGESELGMPVVVSIPSYLWGMSLQPENQTRAELPPNFVPSTSQNAALTLDAIPPLESAPFKTLMIKLRSDRTDDDVDYLTALLGRAIGDNDMYVMMLHEMSCYCVAVMICDS